MMTEVKLTLARGATISVPEIAQMYERLRER